MRDILPGRTAILRCLKRNRWVIADVAREMGVSRQAIYDAMKRHKIPRRPQSRAVWLEMRSRGGEGYRRLAASKKEIDTATTTA